VLTLRRLAVVAALLVAGAWPASATAGAARPTHLWYRITVFGWYQETLDGTSPSGIVHEDEYVSWTCARTLPPR
jgi:hypothetical protein